jgi:hypothetical protein
MCVKQLICYKCNYVLCKQLLEYDLLVVKNVDITFILFLITDRKIFFLMLRMLQYVYFEEIMFCCSFSLVSVYILKS